MTVKKNFMHIVDLDWYDFSQLSVHAAFLACASNVKYFLEVALCK
jgi:hypothetical protein